jgi:hypothetical protein
MSDRYKMKITQVGTVDADGTVRGFHFNGDGKGVGLCVENGVQYIAGYTVEELRDIAAPPSTQGKESK